MIVSSLKGGGRKWSIYWCCHTSPKNYPRFFGSFYEEKKRRKKKQEENIGNHSDGLGGIKENPSACLLLLLFDPIRRIERNPLSTYILCIQPVQRTVRGGNEKKKVRSDTAHSSLLSEKHKNLLPPRETPAAPPCLFRQTPLPHKTNGKRRKEW